MPICDDRTFDQLKTQSLAAQGGERAVHTEALVLDQAVAGSSPGLLTFALSHNLLSCVTIRADKTFKRKCFIVHI